MFNYLQDGDKVWPLGVQLQMTPKDMGLLMGGIKIEGVDGPFYRKNRLVEESPEKPVGEWNKMEFLCKGGEIKVWLNDVLVNDAVCDATERLHRHPVRGRSHGLQEYSPVILRLLLSF